MHRSSPLVPLDSCLTAAAYVSLVHVSACSFAVLQASDLALLVGYVAEEDFNFTHILQKTTAGPRQNPKIYRKHYNLTDRIPSTTLGTHKKLVPCDKHILYIHRRAIDTWPQLHDKKSRPI